MQKNGKTKQTQARLRQASHAHKRKPCANERFCLATPPPAAILASAHDSAKTTTH